MFTENKWLLSRIMRLDRRRKDTLTKLLHITSNWVGNDLFLLQACQNRFKFNITDLYDIKGEIDSDLSLRIVSVTCPKLEEVTYVFNVTDKGIMFLPRLKKVRWINLSQNQITDKGCKYLSQMDYVENLDLTKNQITDKGLIYLAKLKMLQKLWIWDNPITDKGLKFLEQTKPSLNVKW